MADQDKSSGTKTHVLRAGYLLTNKAQGDASVALGIAQSQLKAILGCAETDTFNNLSVSDLVWILSDVRDKLDKVEDLIIEAEPIQHPVGA